MFGALYLFDDEFIHIVSISFTALILTELIMIALTVRTWHWLMVVAEVISFALYAVSVIILSDDYFGKLYFKILLIGKGWKPLFSNISRLEINLVLSISDTVFMKTWYFMWRVVVITAVSCVPLYILKMIRKKVSPSSYQKLTWFLNLNKNV